ncbi:MAG TPA: Wzz/FepE/Etk N-terminal domain-containing protein, partial [Gammaproteobacteria bacterium]|nr:Wzz/FepE/Etk N-terminal domain-containing protein [Gammaproteobacteria bacterium]
MEEQSLEFRDYLDMLRRRRGTIALVAIVIVVVGIAAALLWPPTYQSTATILIEEQEIPQDLVQSTVTSYANQRIQTIQQRVMTRANLLRIIDKYNLYADERKHDTTEEILDEMQDDIGLNMISADVVDPRTGRPTTATIAFTVSFQGENPSVVQQVDNELASLYLSENQKTRTEKASDTYKFLTGEAKRVSDHIADVESQLAAFKEKHVNELPDLQQLNLQMMERTQRDLDDTENRINTTGDRISYLQAQLQQTKPYSPTYSDSGQRVLDPESQLRALETQYLTMAAKYSPEHPDVVRLRREIAGLKKQVGSVDATNDERQQLDSLEGKLAAAREKYSENYPEVVALKKQVAALKKSIKDSPTGDSKGTASKDAGPVSGPEVKDPQNPAYITLQAQLQSAKGDLADLKAKRKDLESKLADYKKR